MPTAPQSFESAGSGPNTNQPRGIMNFQSTINPLASSDVGGTAGHVAARVLAPAASVIASACATRATPVAYFPLQPCLHGLDKS